MARRFLDFVRPAWVNKPVMFAVVAVCVALASFIVLAATLDGRIFSPADALPVAESSEAEACRSASEFAVTRLFEEHFRDIALGGCEMLTFRRQDDGGWIVAGAADATQYHAPVTVQWLVKTDRTGRICKYGFGSRGYRPKLLKVATCG